MVGEPPTFAGGNLDHVAVASQVISSSGTRSQRRFLATTFVTAGTSASSALRAAALSG